MLDLGIAPGKRSNSARYTIRTMPSRGAGTKRCLLARGADVSIGARKACTTVRGLACAGALSLLLSCCGDDGVDANTRGGTGIATLSGETTGTTGAWEPPSGCIEVVVEGDFRANSDEALEALRGVTEVRGDLSIREGVSDLEPASCLGRVGGRLSIHRTTDLETLHGLENLESVGAGVGINGNSKLRTTEGLGLRTVRYPRLDGLGSGLGSIHITRNLVLTELRFENLETVGGIGLGECTWDDRVYWGNDVLEDLDGFPALLEGSLFSVNGYAALTSAEGFIQKYGDLFEYGVSFRANPNLSAAETQAAWEAAGLPAEMLTMCGNLGDAQQCIQCPPPP